MGTVTAGLDLLVYVTPEWAGHDFIPAAAPVCPVRSLGRLTRAVSASLGFVVQMRVASTVALMDIHVDGDQLNPSTSSLLSMVVQ